MTSIISHAPIRLRPLRMIGLLVSLGVVPAQEASVGGLAPIDDALRARAERLLQQMTIDEKVAQVSMRCFGDGKDIAGTVATPRPSMEVFRDEGLAMEKAVGRDGIGWVTRLPPDMRVADGVEVLNRVQRACIEGTRLGIPAIITGSGLHGLRAAGATSYPQSIAMAATFNPSLYEEVAAAAAIEARSRGVRQVLQPVLDLGREPRHGRVEETYGEDALLAARMGVAFVRGHQSQGVITTIKHFLANYVGDGGREGVNVPFSERELREVHMVPYEAAVREAGALGVMTAYNAIDGLPCSSNPWLLTTVLRQEWGFQGVVISDAASVLKVFGHQRQAVDRADAGRRCMEAGLDVDLPRPSVYYKVLKDQIALGKLDVRYLDAAVRRILLLKLRLGLFDAPPYIDKERALAQADTPAQRALALKAARQSPVLLKNRDHILPLGKDLTSIAVVGPNADVLSLGAYSAVGITGDTPLVALRKQFAGRATVTYARGCGLDDDVEDGFGAAVQAAKAAQVCVMVMGGSYGRTGGESQERATLELMGRQEDLIERVAATGTPVVVVLVDGRPVVMNRWIDKVAAVVMAWYGGEEGGTAIAEILAGECNPSGKLPITFPRFTGQAPMTYDARPYGREGGYAELAKDPQLKGVRYTPRFPFGFGLSYTTFGFSDLQCTPATVSAGLPATVSVTVTNTGAVAGDEVVQLYTTPGFCRITQPERKLRHFTRIHLDPGQATTVTFTLTPDDLSFLNERFAKEVVLGATTIRVGDSAAADLSTTLMVTSPP